MSGRSRAAAKATAISAERARERSAERLGELEFLLEMGTSVPEALRRLEFPNTEAATAFCRKHGRGDLARLVGLQGGTGDPFTELWERAFLVVRDDKKHSPKEKAS